MSKNMVTVNTQTEKLEAGQLWFYKNQVCIVTKIPGAVNEDALISLESGFNLLLDAYRSDFRPGVTAHRVRSATVKISIGGDEND